MARPHPVVCFTTELSYWGGGSGYHPYIAIYLIVEQVEFISCIEGQCFYLDTRFTVQIALFQFFFGEFVEKRSCQRIDFRHFSGFDFLVYEVGDVYDTMYETEF